ncbi:phage tail protein [Brucella anthropi]|uniref:phage tail protein n=1 Tax=Brucella anthropi TaxID=529 RepID=UPI000F6735C4|nr:phage tail protein [Brucella anthropi]RRY08791.1 phage tail protein [Brucella anthropi]
MLAALGSTLFEVSPLNFHETSHETGGDFAEKSVMGRRPTLEWVGESSENWTIQGRLFPHKFGGLSNLEGLHQQRRAGKPLPYMRGDGTPLGWVVIEKISEQSSYIDAKGLGRVIEFTVSVKRSDPPAKTGIFSIMSGLLG